VFAFEGQQYDSCNMFAYETGNPGVPLVYVTSDLRTVFVLTCGREGVTVHRADAPEIRYLAEHFNVDALKDLPEHKNAPAIPTDGKGHSPTLLSSPRLQLS